MNSDGIVPQDSQSRQEGNMAKVFMGIILVFLICHMPRNILNIHEMFVWKHAMACLKMGQRGFEFWALFMNMIK